MTLVIIKDKSDLNKSDNNAPKNDKIYLYFINFILLISHISKVNLCRK